MKQDYSIKTFIIIDFIIIIIIIIIALFFFWILGLFKVTKQKQKSHSPSLYIFPTEMTLTT